MAEKILTPQQELFLERYTNPKSPTFSNAKQSALLAGYTEDYADNLTSLMPDWLSENIGDARLIQKAYKNLDKALEGLLDDPEKGAKIIQYKASEFTLKNRQNDKFGDKKNIDITTKGEKIVMNEEVKEIANEYEQKLKEKL